MCHLVSALTYTCGHTQSMEIQHGINVPCYYDLVFPCPTSEELNRPCHRDHWGPHMNCMAKCECVICFTHNASQPCKTSGERSLEPFKMANTWRIPRKVNVRQDNNRSETDRATLIGGSYDTPLTRVQALNANHDANGMTKHKHTIINTTELSVGPSPQSPITVGTKRLSNKQTQPTDKCEKTENAWVDDAGTGSTYSCELTERPTSRRKRPNKRQRARLAAIRELERKNASTDVFYLSVAPSSSAGSDLGGSDSKDNDHSNRSSLFPIISYGSKPPILDSPLPQQDKPSRAKGNKAVKMAKCGRREHPRKNLQSHIPDLVTTKYAATDLSRRQDDGWFKRDNVDPAKKKLPQHYGSHRIGRTDGVSEEPKAISLKVNSQSTDPQFSNTHGASSMGAKISPGGLFKNPGDTFLDAMSRNWSYKPSPIFHGSSKSPPTGLNQQKESVRDEDVDHPWAVKNPYADEVHATPGLQGFRNTRESTFQELSRKSSENSRKLLRAVDQELSLFQDYPPLPALDDRKETEPAAVKPQEDSVPRQLPTSYPVKGLSPLPRPRLAPTSRVGALYNPLLKKLGQPKPTTTTTTTTATTSKAKPKDKEAEMNKELLRGILFTDQPAHARAQFEKWMSEKFQSTLGHEANGTAQDPQPNDKGKAVIGASDSEKNEKCQPEDDKDGFVDVRKPFEFNINGVCPKLA